MKHLLPFCLLSLLLAGCATTMEYGHEIGDWIGHTVGDLYAKLGKPDSSEPQPDGGKVVSYERKEVVPAAPDSKAAQQQSAASDNGAAKTPSTATPPPNTRIVSCTTRYKTDSTGVIRSWTIDGEGCKAYEEPYAEPVTDGTAKPVQ